MSRLTLAAVSPTIRIGDLEGNLTRIVRGIQDAAGCGAGLIVLPELATSGYVFADREEAESLALTRDDERWDAVHAAIPEGVVVVVGYCESAGSDLFNSAAVLTSTTRLADYRKAHLWGAESLVFTPGDAAGILVDTDFGRLGVAICYDNEFPEVPRNLALGGADVLALPVNWPLVPRPEGEHPPELIQAMAAARSSRLPTVIADRHGDERGVSWTGGTAIVDEQGWVVEAFRSGLTLAAVSVADARNKGIGEYNDLFADRRSELY
ncbi:nitrilase-related carbon-nitrogen hydrolase [Microbacterium sp. AK031]|uniref:nitrilase-related carbon-nitrogen hydrolase n=1 Tax=Microbacterium sp. AK031 TaxID=2723076 RepID=UPI0021694E5A|nr:nitrilase-related carbon-nitrogen hydrolase [Microbacterium sp. AK031]MCS3844637.1 putative amidohydrolase [Microbacterium sp. AK031]